MHRARLQANSAGVSGKLALEQDDRVDEAPPEAPRGHHADGFPTVTTQSVELLDLASSLQYVECCVLPLLHASSFCDRDGLSIGRTPLTCGLKTRACVACPTAIEIGLSARAGAREAHSPGRTRPARRGRLYRSTIPCHRCAKRCWRHRTFDGRDARHPAAAQRAGRGELPFAGR